jgi:hypothetical protein
MEFQHARAGIVVSARNRYRTGFNLAFLFVLSIGILLTVQNTARHDGAVYKRAAVSLRQVVERDLTPPPPSAFEIESAMSPGDLMKRWDPLVTAAARKFGVSEKWIRAVMRMESGGRTSLVEGQPIISPAGAMGLMQVMPGTYDEMRVQYGLGADPYDPHDNIFAGAAYLSFLYRKYGNPQMFAAYNDGPGNLEQRLAQGNMLPLETRLYLVNVTASVEGRKGTGRLLAQLTRPNGDPVLIDCSSVVRVRAAMPDEYAPGVLTVVTVGKVRQGVREDPAKATAIIRAHGGAI